ncbi:MAG: ICEA Protein [candidate division CPR1 bacterium ADurb.Bin160]|uniref:ICEA Protein n=1 Tax=candidate division CPR1 bacterium ADurb.Bin160 TaxID=1852826 RepID=A0A1V5ZIS9_9BACT|nr:MAG: ICEA Protein [candidate division CPR1 bacterium ADurb.Bin160]
MMSKTKKELFLELAKPDENGVSRWVSKTEFVGEYSKLMFTNGWDWGRGSSPLASEYILDVDRTITSGNGIDRIRTNGFNTSFNFKQNIRSDIKNYYSNEKCVMLGIQGISENTKIEIDHKAGSKNSERVSNIETQNYDDFQPLTKAANDAKRQICKRCQETDFRFDAKDLKGNPISYYKGNEKFSESGCEGCYQYDPVKYRETILEMAKRGKI